MRGPGRPTPQLQEYVRGLELKLAVIELELAKSKASEADLASAKKVCWALKEEIEAVQVQLAGALHSPVAMTPELVAQQQLLQSQVPLISDNCYILPWEKCLIWWSIDQQSSHQLSVYAQKT